MERRMFIALAGLGSLAAHAQGPARDEEEDALARLLMLQKAEVQSTTKTARRLQDAPGIVTTITAREIEESGARTLADLLKRIPGVQIADNRANVLMVWIRGVTTTYNERVLLLFDGVPKRDATLSEWAPDERIDLQNIERVEVIRGPGSALFGGNAYGGVINIYSKKNVKDLEFSAGGGNQGTARVGFRGGKGDEDLGLVYAASAFKTDGYLSDRGLVGAPTDNTNARAAHTLKLNGHLSKELTFSFVNGDFDYRYPMHPVNARRDANYVYSLGSVGYASGRGPFHFDSKLYFDNTKIYFYEVVRNPDQSIKQVKEQNKQGMVFGIDGLASYQPGGGSQFLFGVNAERNKATYSEEEWDPGTATPHFFNSWLTQNGEGPGRNSARTTNYAGFAQGELPFADEKVRLTLGARYDHFEGFGGQVSPRLALVLGLAPTTTLKFLYGEAFRPPTFRQLYVVRSGLSQFQNGNPDLKPEVARTLEASLGQQVGTNSFLRVTAFASRYTDTHVTISDGPWQNSGIPRRIAGLELESTSEIPVAWGPVRSLSLFANYGHLIHAYDDTPLGKVDIASVAPHTGNVGFGLRGPSFSLFASGNVVGRRNPGFAYDPGKGVIVETYHTAIVDYPDLRARDNKGGYGIVDLTFRWHLPTRYASTLAFSAFNLMDHRHYAPTHDPDKYYDVLKEERNLLLTYSVRF